jgi:hypothetical protein
MSDRPIAWLIRETHKDGRCRVVTGKCFRNKEAAQAAAVRMTNLYWLRQAFPVFNPTTEQLGWTKP